jgi:hypothetical protein
VEILASDRWIVSCWHGTNECRDVEEYPTDSVVLNRVDLHKAVGRRWRHEQGLTKPGDVGLAILLELVCEYPEARRIVYSWHESWEMDFHKQNGPNEADEEIQRQTLVDLRGLVSVLYRSISPLDAATVKAETYWFEGVNTELAIRLGTTLERSLLKLHELSEALRNDFDLMHMRENLKQEERTDRLQKGLQVLAAALVVPTLVVGGFSANEKLFPWHSTASGVAVIAGAVLIAAVVSYVSFDRWIDRVGGSRRKRRASRASASASPGAVAAGAPRPAHRPARAPARASRGRAA